MSSPILLFQLLIFPSLLCSSTSTAFHIRRHSRLQRTAFEDSMRTFKHNSEDFETYYYNQTLDHFNYLPESYTTFPQKYVMNFKYWGGTNLSAPIFVYLGAEEPLDFPLDTVSFMNDNAFHFQALLVYIEHRYYGESIPFGLPSEKLINATTLGYLSSAQAIADYAAIILHIKNKYQAQKSPAIVIGGSYGGMLASWFRLKYPHVALGALASSAPILYFDHITPSNGYYYVVSKDFREASETCYQTIKQSWAEIDKVASQPDGLAILSKKFRLCSPLLSPYDLKDELDTVYCASAQYNSPPSWCPIDLICGGIDHAVSSGKHILDSIFAGIIAYAGNQFCFNISHTNSSEDIGGFDWQKCSEMVFQIHHGNGTMFPYDTFDLDDFARKCKSKYGVSPRPHWVTTYYGGRDIKSVLEKFGSNIIFSNGLRDPWSSSGILEDISETLRAVTTLNGSHCLDLLPASDDDPEWLVQQRKTERKIVEEWITKYYAHM